MELGPGAKTGGKGDYAPASASKSEARLCGLYLQAVGFGGKGIRTPGLLIANETLYQLSYTPNLPMKNELKHEAKNSSCPPMVSNIER